LHLRLRFFFIGEAALAATKAALAATKAALAATKAVGAAVTSSLLSDPNTGFLHTLTQ